MMTKKLLARLKLSMTKKTWKNILKTTRLLRLLRKKASHISSQFKNTVSELSKQEKILLVKTEQDLERLLVFLCH